MKVLTKKKQNEILSRISGLLNKAIKDIPDVETSEYFVDVLAELTYDVGGMKALNSINNTKWGRNA